MHDNQKILTNFIPMAIGMATWQPDRTAPLSALLAIAGKRYTQGALEAVIIKIGTFEQITRNGYSN